MKNPLILLVRIVSECFRHSRVPHEITPFSKCEKVTVFVDGKTSGVQECVDSVNDFFSKYKKSCTVFVINDLKDKNITPIKGATMLLNKDIRCSGIPKHSKKHPCVDGDEDLCINLLGENNYTAYYCMLCSKAKFKVGIYQKDKKDGLVDLSVTHTEGFSQKDIFLQISSIISSII